MIAVPVAGATALVGLLLRVLDLPLPPRTPLLHLLQPLARATAAPYFARRQQAVDSRSGGREKACRYSVGTSSHRTAHCTVGEQLHQRPTTVERRSATPQPKPPQRRPPPLLSVVPLTESRSRARRGRAGRTADGVSEWERLSHRRRHRGAGGREDGRAGRSVGYWERLGGLSIAPAIDPPAPSRHLSLCLYSCAVRVTAGKTANPRRRCRTKCPKFSQQQDRKSG